jgi:predicted esterase
MRVGHLDLVAASLALLLAGASSGAAQAPQDSAALPRGVVIPEVGCKEKPEQSYALYLPSNYLPDRRWPVLFAFDPAARGRVPVELAREAAEQYGYIVAGSNNSRNGPYAAQIEAADAMMQDVSHRFALDLRRLYATGFSGGARVATMVAQICKDCVAGVFAQGAGFPASQPPTEKPAFVYFAAVGDLDFNYYELVELEPKLDALAVPNRLRRFPGPHQWAPREVWMEAVEWLELIAMKQGRRGKVPAFIAQQFARASLQVNNLETSGDLYAAWQENRRLALDFDGLADTSLFTRRAEELKDSPAVREGARRERAAIEEQRRLIEPIAAELSALPADMFARAQARTRLTQQIADLLAQLKRNPPGEKSKVLRRAQTELFAQSLELGQSKLREKDSVRAVAYFEIAAELLPESPRPFLALARVHAQSGDKKAALRTLRQALATGFSKESLAAFLRDTPELAPFRNDSEFQSLTKPREGPR